MPDPVIHAFFEERKQAWLKKEIKSSMDDLQRQEKESEAEQRFSFECWLPDAAKRAGQISISTHPCTFSHPSARKNKNGSVTSIIAVAAKASDGFLRSGNVEAESDALGNAAALDVYKFLMLNLSDGETLLEHIRTETEQAKALLSIKDEDYAKLRTGFLAMVGADAGDVVTSSKIKQVYFPLNNSGDYHQFSLLTNSGIVFECRKRLDAIRFGIDEEEVGKNTYEADVLTKDELKQARDKRRKNEYFEQPFDEIYGLTTIGYGGTKPQNISVLNNQNGGKAHLLLSVPPALEQRNVQFPKKDFFQSNIRYSHGREAFRALNQIFLAPKSDGKIPLKHLRSGRDNHLQQLTDLVIDSMWQVRRIAKAQYREDTSLLPRYQKVWLLDEFSELRHQQDDWLVELTNKIRDWIISGHQRTNKVAAVLGDAEIQFIQSFVEQYQEAFR